MPAFVSIIRQDPRQATALFDTVHGANRYADMVSPRCEPLVHQITFEQWDAVSAILNPIIPEDS